MAIISASIVNKQGRILLARQFMDISRLRIEGLLSAFPRLLDSAVNTQVTFIDADTVRYVYQPLEDLFLVLVTTKNSNIVEDLATLQLMGRIISEHVPEGCCESLLKAKAFELFFALDEIIVSGKRENTTIEQIQTYLLMDSHEEHKAREAKEQQMENARRVTKQQAKILHQKRRAGEMGNRGGAYGGIGSDDTNMGNFGGYAHLNIPSLNERVGEVTTVQPSSVYASVASSSQVSTVKPAGMSLSKARKTDVSSKVQQEMGIRLPQQQPQQEQATATVLAPTAAAADTKTHEDVHIHIEEKFSGTFTRDGEVGATDIKGELSVLVSNPQFDRIRIVLAPVSNEFQFRAHTKLNKALFATDQVLAMTDGKPFPVQQSVTILRWRLSNPGSVQSPILFTCWPEAGCNVIEYEFVNPSAPTLEKVVVTIPRHGTTVEEPTPSAGTATIRGDLVVWEIPEVNSQHNSTGSIEIRLADRPTASGEVFFPVEVSFQSRVSVGLVRVEEVVATENGLPVHFSNTTILTTEKFTIQ